MKNRKVTKTFESTRRKNDKVKFFITDLLTVIFKLVAYPATFWDSSQKKKKHANAY